MFIPLDEAFDVVHELATQNALDPNDMKLITPELLDEAKRQQAALDVVSDFVANNFGEGDAISPHFDLENGDFRIHGMGTFKDKFDYKQVEWLITDGLGQLASVVVELGLSGTVILEAEQIILDDEGEEYMRKGATFKLFDALSLD
jgi:hypothetical protein